MDRGDDAERPPTTRIGPAGGSGRGLRTVIVLVSLALAVAVVKPWDWVAAPASAPGREGAAIPAASPAVAPTPAPSDWTDVGARIACLSGGSWLAVVDQVDGATVSRSWTRLDLEPAAGPTDAAIARTHAYAEAVPRIGFCAPDSGATGAAGVADTPFRVRAWKLTPAEPATGAREAVEIVPPVVSGGTVADRGAMYGPPSAGTPRSRAGGTRDPESVWAAGASAPGPSRWSPGDGLPDEVSWPPGTYVFRVGPSGVGPSGSEAAWFAIELRGPWTGPEESGAP